MVVIRNVGTFAQEIPGVGVVAPGDEIEVESELAEDLLRRSDYFAKPEPKKKAPAKKEG